MAEVHGTCDERFSALSKLLSDSVDRGDDLGGSIAITIDGAPVVDIWAGWADEARSEPWQENTITNVWSTTKTMTNLSALVLADRGQLDLDAPVSRYWPEFAANGKEGVLVRHFLSHTSGVSGWEAPTTLADICDWDIATTKLAGQAPWWEPGTASGYHALNQGHLVGEVIRRIDGRPLKQFFAEEIAGPLGADFQIGVAKEDYDRVSSIIPPPPLPFDLDAIDTDSPMYKTFTGLPVDANYALTDEWRAADIGAANGHGNARSVARVQSIVSNGGELDGIRLLSPATIDRIFEQQSSGTDLVIGVPLRFGIGYGLPVPETLPAIPDRRICFWGGWGGSIIVNDLDHKMSVSYMMNLMEGGTIGGLRSDAILRAVYGVMDG